MYWDNRTNKQAVKIQRAREYTEAQKVYISHC